MCKGDSYTGAGKIRSPQAIDEARPPYLIPYTKINSIDQVSKSNIIKLLGKD